MRVNTRSTMPMRAERAGTKEPIWAMRTISATTPHLTSWFMIKLMLFIFRTMDSISAARNTSTPLSRLAARVL